MIIALAIVALVTAGLFLHSFDHAQRISPGIVAGELVVATVDLAAQDYSPERAAIEPDYLDTVGLRLLSGRRFAESDTRDAPAVALVNQAMARRFWPQRDPVGRRFHFFGERTELVVGVVADSKVEKLGEDPAPIAYLPLSQWPARGATVNVRVAGDPAALVEPLRRELRALDPALPLTNLGTMSGHLTTALWTPRAGAFVLTVFAAIALALALIGLYGVLAYTVALRRRELAIRLALGAAQGQIVVMLGKEILRVLIPALTVGMIGAIVVSRFTSGLLYDVPVLDSATLTLVPLLFLLTACVAAYWPVRRATRVDPTIALRQ